MKTFSTLVALSILSISAPVAQPVEQTLLPLPEYASQNLNWQKSHGDVSYVSARCAAAYLVIGKYAAGAGMADGKQLIDMGQLFAVISLEAAQAAGASEQFVFERISGLSKLYAEKIKVSKQMHNDAFYPDLKRDIEFCQSVRLPKQ